MWVLSAAIGVVGAAAAVVHLVLRVVRRWRRQPGDALEDLRRLSWLRRDLRRLVAYATAEGSSVLARDEAARLLSRFDARNVRLSSSGGSFSINKRELYVCVCEPSGAWKPYSQSVFEAVNLLAHLVNVTAEHTRTFWDIRERLLRANEVAAARLDPESAGRIVAARRIQRAWRRCVACPPFLVCRRRLAWEFGEGAELTGVSNQLD